MKLFSKLSSKKQKEASPETIDVYVVTTGTNHRVEINYGGYRKSFKNRKLENNELSPLRKFRGFTVGEVKALLADNLEYHNWRVERMVRYGFYDGDDLSGEVTPFSSREEAVEATETRMRRFTEADIKYHYVTGEEFNAFVVPHLPNLLNTEKRFDFL